jgi:hypothetical protein
MKRTELHESTKIRCPYCADGSDFRVMVRQRDGEWYLCGGCGHVSLPSSPYYQCICTNCRRMDRKTSHFTRAPIRSTWNGKAV